MDYLLLIEKENRYKTVIGWVIFFFLFMFLSVYLLGGIGFALSAGLLFFCVLAPLTVGRYKLFMFLWLTVIPFLDPLMIFYVCGINPLTYLVTGLTFPFAILLIYKEFGNVIKIFPFVSYIFVYIIILLLNIFRPSTDIFGLFNEFKFHFIEIFVIFCTIFYLKTHKAETLFKYMGITATINAVVAIFQRVTGIRFNILTGEDFNLLEGFLRPRGLTMHANSLALLMNIYLPIGVYLFLNAKNIKEKILYGSSIILCTLALLFTLTKNAYFILALSLAILFYYLPFKNKLKIFFAFIIFFVLFLLLNNILDLKIFESITSRISNNASFEWRLKVWNLLINNINFFTVLWGNGINSSREYLFSLNPTGVNIPHNTYLQTLYDFGIWGILYCLNFLWAAIYFFKKAIKDTGKERYIYIIPFLVALTYLINAITDNIGMNRVAINFIWVIFVIFYMYSKGYIKSITDKSSN